jgi:uncharacterized phage protein gp47/JayE
MRTYAEDVELVIQAILTRHPHLDARRTGTIINTLAGVIAGETRAAKRHALREIMRVFFSTARGADLDALAVDRRELERNPATGATGVLHLTRSVDGGAVVIPEGTVLTDPEGARYLSTAEFNWTGLAKDVEIEAELTGAETNRIAGLVWSAGGADWTDGIEGLLITNPAALAGGNAEETDAEFRDRIAAWWQTLQRATVAALRYGALSVEGVRRATVDESHIAAEEGGYVDVFVSDGSDGFNATLGNQVKRELDNWRAAGVVVNVWGADVVQQAIQVSFEQEAGGAADAVAKGAAAIRSYVNNLSIGASLRRSQVARAALNADGSLLSCAVNTPAADLVVDPGQVIRCSGVEVV